MKTEQPVVFADFHNADREGRIRLNCLGTIQDLARQGVVLREGLCLRLTDEEIEAEGRVAFSSEEATWVAIVDWNAFQS